MHNFKIKQLETYNKINGLDYLIQAQYEEFESHLEALEFIEEKFKTCYECAAEFFTGSQLDNVNYYLKKAELHKREAIISKMQACYDKMEALAFEKADLMEVVFNGWNHNQ